jgi:hypothetical protein
MSRVQGHCAASARIAPYLRMPGRRKATHQSMAHASPTGLFAPLLRAAACDAALLRRYPKMAWSVLGAPGWCLRHTH